MRSEDDMTRDAMKKLTNNLKIMEALKQIEGLTKWQIFRRIAINGTVILVIVVICLWAYGWMFEYSFESWAGYAKGQAVDAPLWVCVILACAVSYIRLYAVPLVAFLTFIAFLII